LIETDEETIFEKSQKKLDKALTLFKKINHLIGIALCHKELSFIHNKFNKKKELAHSQKEFLFTMRKFNLAKQKGGCEYIERVHGHEISIMSEVVIDTEEKKIFSSEVKKTKKKKGILNDI